MFHNKRFYVCLEFIRKPMHKRSLWSPNLSVSEMEIHSLCNAYIHHRFLILMVLKNPNIFKYFTIFINDCWNKKKQLFSRKLWIFIQKILNSSVYKKNVLNFFDHSEKY